MYVSTLNHRNPRWISMRLRSNIYCLIIWPTILRNMRNNDFVKYLFLTLDSIDKFEVYVNQCPDQLP